jgi:hypothetical protein
MPGLLLNILNFSLLISEFNFLQLVYLLGDPGSFCEQCCVCMCVCMCVCNSGVGETLTRYLLWGGGLYLVPGVEQCPRLLWNIEHIWGSGQSE